MENIIIADDEVRIRKLVGDFLRQAGYNVIEAQDGDEAYELFIKPLGRARKPRTENGVYYNVGFGGEKACAVFLCNKSVIAAALKNLKVYRRIT